MMPVAEMTIAVAPRRFEFERDRFGFANELLWEYRYGVKGGKTTVQRRMPKPDYVLRCFVLVRAARQFFYHARFEPGKPVSTEETYRRLIRDVLGRDPRLRCKSEEAIVIPGYEGLREFSKAWEKLFKAECGGAWRSYFLRSHWRMVFPISRAHQARTAERLKESILQHNTPTIHLVRFPQLDMNHGMILFAVEESGNELHFLAYDPNDPEKPSVLTYNRSQRTFSLPPNLYWAGGALNIIEIFRSWWL